MPKIGVADPDEGRHHHDYPDWYVGFKKRRWTVWKCAGCGGTFRFEPADYAEMEGWWWHEYPQYRPEPPSAPSGVRKLRGNRRSS